MSIRLVEDRSDDTYILHSLTLTLTPALPWLGHQARWQMHGHLKEPVDLTRVTCNVITKYGPVKLLEQNYTLPDLLKTLGATLSGNPTPPAGPWQQTWHLTLPEAIPLAELRILLRARTHTGHNFLALDIALNFSHKYRPTTTSTARSHLLQASHQR
ncbi:hypothetical protein [Streptomyces spinosus]|uniref:hypothetical protein n=1 Tax=Streptomyces spinosus TaxID=2872623 RepID=UPI001CEDCE3F|nr:hypothetical protein [Streptomyces spinosus]